jgi:hypothetical protein
MITVLPALLAMEIGQEGGGAGEGEDDEASKSVYARVCAWL